MTTASKTIPWAFTTRLTTLATNTTIGTATRHDFAAITIALPELTRTIRSVKLRVCARDSFTVATNITGWRIGIKLGAVASDDVDYASTAANTGDHEELIVERDVTAYFVANFGGGATQTCQVGFAVSTAAASLVNNITAELWITYDYDIAAATQLRCAEIPIQGHHTLISTTDLEIGTTAGVSNAPANQIPNLSTFLPEASVSFKEIYLRVTAMDTATTGATPFNLSIKLDSGGTYDARATLEQALQTSVPYRDLVDLTVAPYSITTTAVHALIVKSSIANTFENISAVLVVVYTFTVAGTTRELHSVRIPLENDRSAMEPLFGGTAGDDARYSASLDIQDPGTITLLQSGTVIYDQMMGASGVTTAVYNSGQGVRTYAHANVVRSGPHVYVRRGDIDTSTWALARGVNRLTMDARVSSVAGSGSSEISGYAIVNYTSDVPATGIGTGMRTVAYSLASHPTPASAAVIVAAEEVLPNFPTTPWRAVSTFVDVGIRAPMNTITGMLQAERQTGEDSANGWYTDTLTSGGAAELGRREFIRSINRWVNGSSFRTGRMHQTSTRRWRVGQAFAQTIEWCGTMWITLYDLSFAVAGVVTVGGSPVANGGAVKIYADDGVDAELITSVTTGGGTGAFSATVLDSTRNYFAVYDNGTNRGWSGTGTPGTSTFNIAIPGGGGGGLVAPPIGSSIVRSNV